ncbi:unnamed protein product [Caretta caretta]
MVFFLSMDCWKNGLLWNPIHKLKVHPWARFKLWLLFSLLSQVQEFRKNIKIFDFGILEILAGCFLSSSTQWVCHFFLSSETFPRIGSKLEVTTRQNSMQGSQSVWKSSWSSVGFHIGVSSLDFSY